MSDLWRMLGHIHHEAYALFYLSMHWWIELFGASAFSIRLASAVLIGVAGACVYWLGARLGGPRLGLLGALAFAILPRITWAGIEARPYALTAMLAAGASLLLIIALDTESRSAWIAYSAFLVGGVLSNAFVGLLIAAHLVSIFWDRSVTRSQRLRWLIAAGAAALVSLPFLLIASRGSELLHDHQFGVPELLRNVVVNQWFLGGTPTTTTGISRTTISWSDVGSWWVPAALVVAGVSWLLISVAVISHLRRPSDQSGVRRSAVAWLTPWMLVPTVIIAAGSIVSPRLYNPRYLTFTAPAVALLMALGLLAIRLPLRRGLAIVILAVAALPVFVSQRQIYAKSSTDWVSVAKYLQQNATAGQGVYFVHDVPGSASGQSTRGIRSAYPNELRGLLDVTLMATGVAEGNLTGTSRSLADSTKELSSVGTLWVIRRLDYPSNAAREDDKVLAPLRFRQTAEWRGPLDMVLKYQESRR